MEEAEEGWPIPFKDAEGHVWMEIVGLILMFCLISMSNAGGLSGAGSNIPIMLIFFNFTMAQAVPVSAFVAVCSTTFRFILNYNQRHPNKPERVCINYEIIMLTMPSVFLGSFIGVFLGTYLESENGELIKMCLFGTTVAWSIFTTIKKAKE